jgi:hypothetical protein
MSEVSDIVALTRQLLPTGRAFNFPVGGMSDKYFTALATVEAEMLGRCVGVLDSILPDNPNFTEDDANDWAIRLGIYFTPGTTFADKKKAILRKYAHPGTIKARQNWRYLQAQLRAAGFDVYVHENPDALSPYDVITEIPGTGLFHYTGSYHGEDVYHGDDVLYKVANSIYDSVDALFEVPDADYSSTLFIGGETLGSFATVDDDRRLEFRQLILTLKPAHLVAFLFINFD